MWKRRGELIQLYILMFQTHTRPHKGKSVTWMHFDPRYMNKRDWSLIIICKRHLWNRATSATLLSAVQVLFSFHCHLGPSCINVSSGKQQQAAKGKKSIVPPPPPPPLPTHTHLIFLRIGSGTVRSLLNFWDLQANSFRSSLAKLDLAFFKVTF